MRQSKCSMWAAGALVAAVGAPLYGQTPLGSEFTYQGRLVRNGQTVSEPCDFVFTLYNAEAGGNALGRHAVNGVPVTNGLFTVALNGASQFGADAFIGEARWLQIDVRCPTESGNIQALAPRQLLTPAPQALVAREAANGSLWTPAGISDIFYNAGNVAIGTDTATSRLTIRAFTHRPAACIVTLAPPTESRRGWGTRHRGRHPPRPLARRRPRQRARMTAAWLDARRSPRRTATTRC